MHNVVVTGGSRGIGLAISRRLVAAGYNVIAVARRESDELRGERYYFVGRRGGIINIGGLKVHPEEIEAVINRHPEVRMSRARSRRSPITGGIVVADVILADGCDTSLSESIRAEIFAACKAQLASHKVPVMIKFVPSLDITAAGKLARHDA